MKVDLDKLFDLFKDAPKFRVWNCKCEHQYLGFPPCGRCVYYTNDTLACQNCWHELACCKANYVPSDEILNPTNIGCE